MFKFETGIGAIFHCAVKKVGTGEVVRESGEFQNIVLTSGLKMMGSVTWGAACVVGTGNSVPNVNQTTLDAPLFHTSSVENTVDTSNKTTAPYYLGTRRVFRFAPNTIVGNLQEIALCNPSYVSSKWSYPCWNRALIKDANGNPTTLTILADEFLDVTVEIRIYPKHAISGTFTFTDRLGATISTHTYTGYSWIGQGQGSTNSWKLDSLGVYSGASIDSNPSTRISGTRLWYNSAQVNTLTGDTTMRHETKATLTQGNGTVNGIEIGIGGVLNSTSGFGYKLTFNPPITKTSSQEFTWTVDSNWGQVVP